MNSLIVFKTALNAILPVILLILLGFILRCFGLLSQDFVKNGSTLGFSVFLPCSLFMNVYSIESMTDINWDIVIFTAVMIGVLFLLGILSSQFATTIPERKGVVLQTIFRSNVAVIGLPISYALGGEDAVAVTSIIIAFTLPILNIAAVTALSLYIDKNDRGPSLRNILTNIVKNPLIQGICLGLVVLLIRAAEVKYLGCLKFSLKENTEFLYVTLQNIQKMASPFMLIMLGGQFDFSACKGMFREIVIGTLWRTVLAPALVIGTAVILALHTPLLNNNPAYYPALIAMFGTPTAVSGPIMAGQMGSDQQLATQFVVWTSVVSVITIFITSSILMYFGLIPL